MRLSLASDKWNTADDGDRVAVAIDGVGDRDAVSQIEQTIRGIMRDAHLAGKWNVALSPATLKGRWDVVVKGPAVRHMFTFLAADAQVAQVIGGHVRRAIERMRPVP